MSIYVYFYRANYPTIGDGEVVKSGIYQSPFPIRKEREFDAMLDVLRLRLRVPPDSALFVETLNFLHEL